MEKPTWRYRKTLWSFKLNLIPLLMLQLQGFCRLGSCEMVLLWLSGGAKHRLLFWGLTYHLNRWHLSDCSFVRILYLAQNYWVESSSDAATVENLIWETQTLQRVSFLEMMDEQDFRCKELSHLGLSTSVDSVLEGSVLLHFSVQLTRKQVEVSYNYTSRYWWKSLKERTLR